MDSSNFGIYISKLRKNNYLTQRELAYKLHVSDKTVSKYEMGVYIPSLDILYKMAKIFNIPFEDILKRRINEKEIVKKDNKKLILNLLLIFNIVIKLCTIILPVFIKYKYLDALNIISVGLLCLILYLELKKDL